MNIIDLLDDVARLKHLKEERNTAADKIQYNAAYFLEEEDAAIRELELNIENKFNESVDEEAFLKDKTERDQLIKVVDELAHGIEAFRDFGCAKHGTHYDVMMKCYEAYSLLPHVQAKKGNK